MLVDIVLFYVVQGLQGGIAFGQMHALNEKMEYSLYKKEKIGQT